MISLKAFKSGVLNNTDVANALLEVISVEDIFIYSNYELVYRSLQQFNIRKLEQNENSIKKYAQLILGIHGFLKNVEHPIEMFAAIFLKKSPQLLQVKNQLEVEAKSHLAQLDRLITDYHNLPFIQEYINKPSTPRSNEERKQLTFYKRTLVKREEIVQYLLHDILKRAIEKSSRSEPDWGKGLENWQREIQRKDDFPYLEMPYGWDIKYILNMEKLDYRLINPLLNKVGWMDIDELYGHGYSEKTNLSIQTRVTESDFFGRLISELEGIPVVRQRADMFMEMSDLFVQQKWYALYALALPQVEGIFSEVIEMISRKKNTSSLTDKVNFVRSYFEHAHYTFDYYEFTLTDLRNSFSHTGKVDDPKTRSFHLLLDIKYLLNIIIELDTPLSKISKIIGDGATRFKHIGDFNHFIRELQKSKDLGKLDIILPMASDFLYKKLLKELKLKKMLALLEQDLIVSRSRFNDGIGILVYDREFKVFDSSIPEIERKLIEISKGYNRMGILVSDQWKLLTNTYNVLFSFAVLFPKVPKTLKTQMDRFKVKYSKEFNIISFLIAKANMEVPEDFLLYERELVHQIR